MSKKLNILRCVDQNWWAYAHIAREHRLYTKHNMTHAKHDEVKLDGIDIIYIHSPDISNYHATKLTLEAKERGIKVIGGYAGNPKYWTTAEKQTYTHADLIVSISPQTYQFGKFHYTNIPTIFMPESVDTNFFYPVPKNNNEFRIGWAGGSHKKIKRCYLLDKLDYPVIKMDNWKQQRYSQEKLLTLSNMREFYQSLDVLLLTSESECMPRVIMEAMSCEKAVISTDVGGVRLLLDQEWLVPAEGDDEIIRQINNKLKLLKDNKQLCKEVGERNRNHLIDTFSWESNAQLWDLMFESVYNNDINTIVEVTENRVEPHKTWFDSFKIGG